MFEDTQSMQYLSKSKAYLLAKCDQILGDEKADKTVNEMKSWLFNSLKVKVFGTSESPDKKNDNNYLLLVNSMNENAPEDVSKLSTLRFFSYLDYLQTKAKKNEAETLRNKRV